jgi:hypothetical protein
MTTSMRPRGMMMAVWAACRTRSSSRLRCLWNLGPCAARARPRRYCFHFDEVAEAEAQGLPYVLVPRQLSREEWEKKYCLGFEQ